MAQTASGSRLASTAAVKPTALAVSRGCGSPRRLAAGSSGRLRRTPPLAGGGTDEYLLRLKDAAQAFVAELQQALAVDELEKLLGLVAARQRPKPRAGASRHDHAVSHLHSLNRLKTPPCKFYHAKSRLAGCQWASTMRHMPLTCNIDAHGKRSRLISGLVMLAHGGICLAVYFACYGGGTIFGWIIPGRLHSARCILCVFEARAGWCAMRAMGFKTKR
jgi:hypothetical protein